MPEYFSLDESDTAQLDLLYATLQELDTEFNVSEDSEDEFVGRYLYVQDFMNRPWVPSDLESSAWVAPPVSYVQNCPCPWCLSLLPFSISPASSHLDPYIPPVPLLHPVQYAAMSNPALLEQWPACIVAGSLAPPPPPPPPPLCPHSRTFNSLLEDQ